MGACFGYPRKILGTELEDKAPITHLPGQDVALILQLVQQKISSQGCGRDAVLVFESKLFAEICVVLLQDGYGVSAGEPQSQKHIGRRQCNSKLVHPIFENGHHLCFWSSSEWSALAIV